MVEASVVSTPISCQVHENRRTTAPLRDFPPPLISCFPETVPAEVSNVESLRLDPAPPPPLAPVATDTILRRKIGPALRVVRVTVVTSTRQLPGAVRNSHSGDLNPAEFPLWPDVTCRWQGPARAANLEKGAVSSTEFSCGMPIQAVSRLPIILAPSTGDRVTVIELRAATNTAVRSTGGVTST